jgi:hypothetical protein
MEVLLGLLPLHVITEAIYTPICNNKWKPKSTLVTLKSWDMKHEPILLMGTHLTIPRYVYHKPFKIQSEWQNWLSPHNKGGLVWYMDASET